MSLDWNTKKCPGNGVTSGWITRDGVGGERTEIHPDTNSLTWGAFCGVYLGAITPKNIDEWVWRIAFLKYLDRPWMSDRSFPSIEALDNHLDLWTNCDSKTRKQFTTFVMKCIADNVTKDIQNMYTTLEHVQLASVS